MKTTSTLAVIIACALGSSLSSLQAQDFDQTQPGPRARGDQPPSHRLARPLPPRSEDLDPNDHDDLGQLPPHSFRPHRPEGRPDGEPLSPPHRPNLGFDQGQPPPHERGPGFDRAGGPRNHLDEDFAPRDRRQGPPHGAPGRPEREESFTAHHGPPPHALRDQNEDGPEGFRPPPHRLPSHQGDFRGPRDGGFHGPDHASKPAPQPYRDLDQNDDHFGDRGPRGACPQPDGDRGPGQNLPPHHPHGPDFDRD